MNTLNDSTATVSKNAKLFGLFVIILGILAISAPMIAGISVAFIVGLLVLAGGVTRMVWALQADNLKNGLPEIAISILTLLCGVILITEPLLVSGFLTIILAVYFLADGAFEIAAAFKLRPVSGWVWLLTGGVVSFLLGLLIWQQFPLSGAWAIGVLLGIKLLFVGVTILSIGTNLKSA